MTPHDLDLAHRCQRVLDDAAAERLRRTDMACPFSASQLRFLSKEALREYDARKAMRDLPAVAKDFGHDPIALLRASDEHAYAIMQRRA